MGGACFFEETDPPEGVAPKKQSFWMSVRPPLGGRERHMEEDFLVTGGGRLCRPASKKYGRVYANVRAA